MTLGQLGQKARAGLEWVFAPEPFGADAEPTAQNGGVPEPASSPEPEACDPASAPGPAGAPESEAPDPASAPGPAGAPESEAPEPASAPEPGLRYQRLRFWIAIGIVIAAISVAAGGWRAEIFTEYATQNEGLARQDLTGIELSQRSDIELAGAQFRQLGSFETNVLMATRLGDQAYRTSGRASARLGAQAQNEWTLAGGKVTGDFPDVSPTEHSSGLVSVNPTSAYALAVLSDPALATFDATDLSGKAKRARDDAVDMAGVTVFFALVVVLLTLSEMVLRRRTATPGFTWTSGHTLSLLAVVVWLGSAVLFALLYLQVPSLQ
jgi:heme A synthase